MPGFVMMIMRRLSAVCLVFAKKRAAPESGRVDAVWSSFSSHATSPDRSRIREVRIAAEAKGGANRRDHAARLSRGGAAGQDPPVRGPRERRPPVPEHGTAGQATKQQAHRFPCAPLAPVRVRQLRYELRATQQ